MQFKDVFIRRYGLGKYEFLSVFLDELIYLLFISNRNILEEFFAKKVLPAWDSTVYFEVRKASTFHKIFCLRNFIQ